MKLFLVSCNDNIQPEDFETFEDAREHLATLIEPRMPNLAAEIRLKTETFSVQLAEPAIKFEIFEAI